jgi:hypothetical protein
VRVGDHLQYAMVCQNHESRSLPYTKDMYMGEQGLMSFMNEEEMCNRVAKLATMIEDGMALETT